MTAGADQIPTIVGVGQLKAQEVAPDRSPVELMEQAARIAASDSGSLRILNDLDAISVVLPLSWRYRNAPALLSARLESGARRLAQTFNGGDGPQRLIADAADAITAGEIRCALIAGAEARRTKTALQRQGLQPKWEREDPNGARPSLIGVDRPGASPSEAAVGFDHPVIAYAIMESAIGTATGRERATQAELAARLWASMSEVAAENPAAWTRRSFDASELLTPSADNRMIASPYTKRLCANSQVDQAAAILICSDAEADRAGVPKALRVYPAAIAGSTEIWHLSQRQALHQAPALARAAEAVLELADLDLSEIGLLDLYSCFPSAVQIAAKELGIDPFDARRSPTVTGGLSFAGGPGNNFSLHAVAAITNRLRAPAAPAAGLVTSTGWYLTKHAMGVYTKDRPPRPFRWHSLAEPLDTSPRPPTGRYESTVEAYTVVYGRDGAPESAVAALACASGPGRRFGRSAADSVLTAFVDGDPVGASAWVEPSGEMHLVV